MKNTIFTLLVFAFSLPSFSQNLQSFEINGKYGFINIKGDIIIPAQYDDVKLQSDHNGPIPINKGAERNGEYADKEGGKWGFLSQTGKEITPFQFDQVKLFKYGTAEVKVNDKWGVINETGEFIVECIYDKFRGDLHVVFGNKKSYRYSLRKAVKDDKLGYLDFYTCELVVPCIYDEIIVAYGIAVIKKSGKYGYYDIFERKEIIPTKYDNAEPFDEWGNEDTKTAKVTLNGRVFSINYSGKEVK